MAVVDSESSTRLVFFEGDGGIRLAASEAGDHASPAVLLLHGGGQTRHAWSNAARRLARAGYHAIALDLRGHGESAWSPDGLYDFEVFGRDVVAVLDTLRKPTALVGASMGGQSSIRALASGRAANVKALVLVDIVPKPARAGVRKVTEFMTRNLSGFASIEEVADTVAAYNINRSRPSDVSGLRRNLREGADGRLYWHWDPKVLTMGDSEEKLDAAELETMEAMTQVNVPCLLVRGGNSDVVDADAMSEFRSRIRGLQIAEVAGAGHMVAGDRNDAFNDAVVAFLAGHLPPRAD